MCKKDGGLGVPNLNTQNEALILKYLDKFFNKADIPWVHLVWEKHYSNGKLPKRVFLVERCAQIVRYVQGFGSCYIRSRQLLLPLDRFMEGSGAQLDIP